MRCDRVTGANAGVSTDTFFECHNTAGVPMASLAKQSRPCWQERNRRYPEEMVSSRISTYSDKENCTQNASTLGYSSTVCSKMAGRHLTREYSVLNIDRESGHSTKTIALFGAETKTGNEFLRMALDAGYSVRAMSLPHVPSQSDYAGLEWVRANSLFDKEAVELVIQDADFVVCMVNAESATEPEEDEERCPKSKSATAVDASKPVTSFIDILYPLMKMEKSIQVFLLQASSLASDTRGNTPILSRILKSVRTVKGVASHAIHRKPKDNFEIHVNELADLDSAIRRIGQNHRGRRPLSGKSKRGGKQTSFAERTNFSFVITRPTTFLTDAGSSTKKVSASKSQPGPFPISHADLAEFSLNALLLKKLQNSCPYVVTDSF